MRDTKPHIQEEQRTSMINTKYPTPRDHIVKLQKKPKARKNLEEKSQAGGGVGAVGILPIEKQE